MENNLIGISTSSGYEFLSLEKRFELFGQAGFQSVMLWWGNDEKATRKERTSLAKRFNFKIENVHADMANSNSLWEHSSAGADKLKELVNAVDECKYYGIKRMVIHITNGLTPPPISGVGFKRLEFLFNYAIKKEIVLAIENVRIEEHTRYVLDHYKDKHIAFCYDSGHANLWCKSVDWLSLYSDRIVAVHLHDNKGVEDSHSIPFSGTVNWTAIMRQLKKTSYQGSLTMETEYRGKEDITLLVDFLKKSYQSGLELKRL